MAPTRLYALALLALLAATLHAGAAPPDDDAYAEARGIVSGLQRIVAPTGVQETHTVSIGGIDQVLTVRGMDRANPILLYLHGGPAAPMMPASWTFQKALGRLFHRRAVGSARRGPDVPRQ